MRKNFFFKIQNLNQFIFRSDWASGKLSNEIFINKMSKDKAKYVILLVLEYITK